MMDTSNRVDDGGMNARSIITADVAGGVCIDDEDVDIDVCKFPYDC